MPRCEKTCLRGGGGGGGRKACFKSVSSAIETSWKIEISPVAGLYVILSKN